MFYILGADHAQYGPATVEEVRQWIRDGRADGQTMGKMDGGEWTPLSHFPEFADLTGPGAPPPLHGTLSADEILVRDYQIDIEGYVTRAWKVLQANMGPVVGVTVLMVVLETIINQIIGLISRDSTREMVDARHLTTHGVIMLLVTSVLSLPLQTVFTGGMFKYCIKLVRGQQAEVSDLFAGFTGPLVSLSLLGLAVGLVGLLPMGVGLFMWLQYGFSAETILSILVCLIPTIYLSAGFIFAIPLTIDREIGFADAMLLSLKVVNKHWFWVFALVLLIGALSAAGLIACCVGVLVTVPLGYLTLMCAYEDIFGRRTA